jgi:hypothetical protein
MEHPVGKGKELHVETYRFFFTLSKCERTGIQQFDGKFVNLLLTNVSKSFLFSRRLAWPSGPD